jgi:proline iminopeptidase
MDQRGCGRSRPLGAIAHNTTHHLIRDVESLRQHLAVDSWLLFGGSWGSSLALAYAVANPGRASGLILRGVFLATRREVDWFLYGLRAFIPIARDAFADGCKDDVLGHYLRLLDQGGLPAAHAARRWGNYENAAIALGDGSVFSGPDGPADSNEIARVRIQTHYLAHDCFLQPDELLERMSVLSHLPAEIVQGCLDMVCPPETAVRVSAKLPRSRLTLVPGAGHSATHPALASNLVAATDRFRNYLEPQS